MQANSILRKRAFRLYRQNRGILWAAFLIFTLVNALWYEVRTYQIQNILAGYILNIVYQLLIAPVMSLGLYHMLLRMINGDKAELSMLFDFVRTPKVFFMALAVGLATLIPDLLILIYSIVASVMIAEMTRDQTTILTMITVAVFGVGIWMMLRLFLLPYMYVSNPQESVMSLVSSSFTAMKGQVGKLIWFEITVFFLPALLVIVLLYMINPLVNLSFILIDKDSRYVFQLITSLFMVLVSPYFDLAFAGYANELLESAKNLR
jgi:hypothetical protein